MLTRYPYPPPVNFNAFDINDPATNAHVDVQADHFKVVREIGAAGTVLLKNVDGALPLSKPKSIALIGASPPPPPHPFPPLLPAFRSRVVALTIEVGKHRKRRRPVLPRA